VGDGFVDLGAPLASLLVRTALVALLLTAVVLLAAVGVTRLRRRRALDEPAGIDHAGSELEPAARRFLRIAFGALWIVDGLLQTQPLMPAGFISANISPHLVDEPGWLRDLTALLARGWERHPVAADVAIVWLEIGLGLMLIAGHRAFGRIGPAVAGAVALAIWVLGEGLGGLLSGGAGWLTGAPGAALVYVVASALLLLPPSWWVGTAPARGQRITRHAVSGWFAVAALLQALPADDFWAGRTLSEPFAAGAAMSQPSWLSAPMRAMARAASDHPTAVNLMIIVVLVGVAAWLELDARQAPVIAGLVVCALTWWVGQDFGVLGGTATDPNTALPLALVLGAALPRRETARSTVAQNRSAVRAMAWRATTVIGVVLAVAVPISLVVDVVGPPDSAALAADSQGGLRKVPSRAVPSFALTDQDGRRIDSADLRGKVVVITFLDPVCTTECPLIADQLADADRRLGALGKRVEVIAIDSNPVFHRVADVAAFTQSHGLASLPNWHFLCGEPVYTQDVLAEFGMAINVPTVGMIAHSSGVLFLSADGREAAYLQDGAADELTASYTDLVGRELRSLAQ
jgi:cytochrome oxidase Cu insertion factor (SCO1/SenC/PrrC family)